jgi:hypothetical protein
MADAFADFTSGLESPALRVFEVTPSDTTDLDEVSRALNVASTGTVRVTTVHGTTATIHIAAGIAFPIRVSRVWSTDTTATNIVALS